MQLICACMGMCESMIRLYLHMCTCAIMDGCLYVTYVCNGGDCGNMWEVRV